MRNGLHIAADGDSRGIFQSWGCVMGYTFILAGEKPYVNRKLAIDSSSLQHSTIYRAQIISSG